MSKCDFNKVAKNFQQLTYEGAANLKHDTGTSQNGLKRRRFAVGFPKRSGKQPFSYFCLITSIRGLCLISFYNNLKLVN